MRRNAVSWTNVALAAAPQKPEKTAYLPVFDQKDIEEKHKKIANEALLSLPAECRDALQNFYVRYNNPEQRGLAGKNTMILSGNVSDTEFRALFIHEFGHITDLGCLRGTPESGESAFRDGNEVMYQDDPSVEFYAISWVSTNVQRHGMKKADFVSGYAAWDPFEDLAEAYAYYILQYDDFVERARTNTVIARKLQWMETYVGSSVRALATGKAQWKGNVPWDITKLAYHWNMTETLVQK